MTATGPGVPVHVRRRETGRADGSADRTSARGATVDPRDGYTHRHPERWDGTGYPDGLTAEEIEAFLEGRDVPPPAP